MKVDKTERCGSKLRKRSKRSLDDIEGRSSVICSDSFIVPGNPLNPRSDEIPGETYRCASKYERRLSRQESYMRLRDLQTPLQPILRSENDSKKIQRECEALTPLIPKNEHDKRSTHGLVLPDIGLSAFLCTDQTAKEIQDAFDQPDFQYIRQTRSGIAYNFMYGSPTCKPRRLPKIVSDGAIRYKGNDKDGEHWPSAKRSKHKSLRINGEELTDQLRSSANQSRLKRERKNLEKVKSHLQMQEDRVPRRGRSSRASQAQSLIDDNAARIRDVTVKQNEIRAKEHMRTMKRIVKQMKRP